MRTEALEHLVCPEDGSALSLTGPPGENGQTVAGRLECAEGHGFEIRDGVPFMADERGSEDGQVGTSDSFGARWAGVRDKDHPKVIAFQHDWYDERYGFGGDDGLAGFLEDKGAILDAGCGIGRDVARYARLSDAQVYGFDLSDAVVRASHEFSDVPRANYLQADILAPPFPPESFDYVVSDQVIHHTPDAPRAFRTLAGLVAPGGEIAVYVYRKKAMLRELADTHIREITTEMSYEECVEFSEGVMELGRELSRLNATVTLDRGVPLLGIEPGEHDVQRLIYWHFLKCFWNEELGENLSLLGSVDWYHPPYASRHTPEEVEGWIDDAGFELVHLDVIESGISVRAKRP